MRARAESRAAELTHCLAVPVSQSKEEDEDDSDSEEDDPYVDRQRCVELLAGDRRVDWNIKNRNGDTPVMYCLKYNKIEMARCLINTPGVDLDTVDRDGKYLETIATLVVQF